MKSTDFLNLVLSARHYSLTTVAYGELGRHKLDIYLPNESTRKTPIIFIYGGAWKDGKKEDYEFVAHALSGLGHPVIIPDYQLYPDVRFPIFIEDVADAIAYIDENQKIVMKHHFNEDKPFEFILMGHSSGAHAAALLTTDGSYFNQRKIIGQLSGLIAMAGPYDLPLDDPEVTPVFTNNGVLASKKKAKPILNAHPHMPPVLLLHGKQDDRVLPYHTQRFSGILNQLGIPVETHIYAGVNHTQLIGSLAAPLRFLNNSYADIKTFLARY